MPNVLFMEHRMTEGVAWNGLCSSHLRWSDVGLLVEGREGTVTLSQSDEWVKEYDKSHMYRVGRNLVGLAASIAKNLSQVLESIYKHPNALHLLSLMF